MVEFFYSKAIQQPSILYTAVKALIKSRDGKVLVLKQANPTISGNNKYHPPGGIVELGETLHDALRREAQEEIGVDSSVDRLFDVGEWFAERGDETWQFIGLFYVCRIQSDTFTLQDSEVSKVHWIGLDEIDAIDIVEPSKSIIRKYLLDSD